MPAQAPTVKTFLTLLGKVVFSGVEGEASARFGALSPRLSEAGAGSPSPVSSALQGAGSLGV